MFRVDPFSEFAAFWDEPDPRRAMRRACAEIVADLGLTTVFPRPLAPVAARIGAATIRQPGRNGHLRIGADGAVVAIGKDDPWRRSRWTLAHEIGHLLVLHALQGHAPSIRALRESKAHRPLEALCDLAAAELLCPAAAMRPFVEGSLQPVRLQEAYDQFLISWTAVLSRWASEFPYASASIWSQVGDQWQVTRQIGGWRVHEFPHRIRSDAFHDDGVLRDVDRRGASAGVLSYTRNDVEHSYPALAAKLPGQRSSEASPLWHDRRISDEALPMNSIVVLLVDSLFAEDLITPEC